MSSHLTLSPILPGCWLGMLGGGQLGRMFVHAAQSLGYRVCVLDPAADSPAGAAADRHICAAYDEPEALRAFADLCVSVSTEFENVPAHVLALLQSWGVFVAPGSHCIALAQDRIAEKEFLHTCAAETGIDVAPYWVLQQKSDLLAMPTTLFPGILKTARMGYDGKGQIIVNQAAALPAAWETLASTPCVLEQRLPLAYEISVIVVRGYDGACAYYPVVENVHRHGILHCSTLPANHADAALSERVQRAAQIIAKRMDYVGVLCVEFFVLQDGCVVVNEIAPRPHNSGHITADACLTGQFEQQVRAMTRLPLGSTQQLAAAMMINLLGDLWPNGPTGEKMDQTLQPAWEKILALPEVRLHLYGKSEARQGRKMGHLNLLASDFAQAQKIYQQVCGLLNLQP